MSPMDRANRTHDLARASLVNSNQRLKEFFDKMPNYSRVTLQKVNGYWLIKNRSCSCPAMSQALPKSENLRPRKVLDSIPENGSDICAPLIEKGYNIENIDSKCRLDARILAKRFKRQKLPPLCTTYMMNSSSNPQGSKRKEGKTLTPSTDPTGLSPMGTSRDVQIFFGNGCHATGNTTVTCRPKLIPKRVLAPLPPLQRRPPQSHFVPYDPSSTSNKTEKVTDLMTRGTDGKMNVRRVYHRYNSQ